MMVIENVDHADRKGLLDRTLLMGNAESKKESA